MREENLNLKFFVDDMNIKKHNKREITRSSLDFFTLSLIRYASAMMKQGYKYTKRLSWESY